MKIIDQAALTLIDPNIKTYRDLRSASISTLYQILPYIEFDGYDWDWLISTRHQDYLHIKQLCTDHNGWDKFTGYNWIKLLKWFPMLEDMCTQHDGWDKLNWSEWRELLSRHPQFKMHKPARLSAK